MTSADEKLCDISPRQRDIIIRIAKGMTDKEIGKDLALSEATISWHVSFLLRRWKVRARTQAVSFAYEHGIISSRSKVV